MKKSLFSVLLAILILLLCACSRDPEAYEVGEDEPEITTPATATPDTGSRNDDSNVKSDNDQADSTSDNNDSTINNTADDNDSAINNTADDNDSAIDNTVDDNDSEINNTVGDDSSQNDEEDTDDSFYEDNELVYYVDPEGYVVMGHYEQDNDLSNGDEPIEWQILSEDEDGILLISRYVIENLQFDHIPEDGSEKVTTWENCTLRTWLNEDFYENSFSEEEKELIVEAYLENNEGPFGTDCGDDTVDRIFLLSLDEIPEYFNITDETADWSDKYSEELIAVATPYAESRQVPNMTIYAEYYEGIGDHMPLKSAGYSGDVINRRGSYWRLRTSGYDNAFSSTVTFEGEANAYGYYNYEAGFYGTRPAMFITGEARAAAYTGTPGPTYELYDVETDTEPDGDGSQETATGDTENQDPVNPETGMRMLKDYDGNVIAEFNLPEGFACLQDSDPSSLVYYNNETGATIGISFETELWYGELLENGRKVPFGELVVYTDSQTISFEDEEAGEDEYSHNVIPLGEDIYNNNRMVYSVIEYGDVPHTYRNMYVDLGEGRWISIYSSLFQQDGIFNTEAVYAQIDLYNFMF